MEKSPVVVEEQYNVPVSELWSALTDKSKMKEWYFDLDKFEAVPGFEFSFSGKGSKGEAYIHHCSVTEVIPQKKLQHSWKYENLSGNSLVTFDFSEDENGSKLKVTHEGLESFPQGKTDFSKSSFLEGWTGILKKNLKKFLEK